MKEFFKMLVLILLSLGLGTAVWRHAVAEAAGSHIDAPMLVDKTGRDIGPLAMTPPGSYGSVLINVGNDVLVFHLNYDIDNNGVLASNGVTWQTSGPLIYASTDCSGQAYIGFGNLGSRRPVAVLVQNSRWVAYVGEAVTAQVFIAHSYLQSDGACLPVNAERKAVPVSYRLQLSTYGVPPFYVR